jgi:soluble lytic murein transglycosylase
VQWSRPVWIACSLLAIAGLSFWAWNSWLEQSQDKPIRAAAQRYGVDPALVKAVVWRESHFHSDARGRVGEIGLMQLRAEAALEWARAEKLASFDHEQCVDAFTNTLAGTWYLKKLLKRYSATDDPLPYALADYNAGRGNLLKWNSGEATTNSGIFLQRIGFPGTRSYVQAVIRRYQHYRPIFREENRTRRREGARAPSPARSRCARLGHRVQPLAG